MDGGTLAEHLIPIIVEYDYLIVLDCVSADGGEIGDVYFFDFDNMPNCVQWQGSAHEVEMMQTLRLMELAGDRPPTKVVGIVPEVVKFITTFEMTKAVIEGSKLMESTLVKHLSELGFTYEVIQPELGIQEVANRACQGDFE